MTDTQSTILGHSYHCFPDTVLGIWLRYKLESNETPLLNELKQYFIFFVALVIARNYLIYLGVCLLISASLPTARKMDEDQNYWPWPLPNSHTWSRVDNTVGAQETHVQMDVTSSVHIIPEKRTGQLHIHIQYIRLQTQVHLVTHQFRQILEILLSSTLHGSSQNGNQIIFPCLKSLPEFFIVQGPVLDLSGGIFLQPLSTVLRCSRHSLRSRTCYVCIEQSLWLEFPSRLCPPIEYMFSF